MSIHEYIYILQEELGQTLAHVTRGRQRQGHLEMGHLPPRLRVGLAGKFLPRMHPAVIASLMLLCLRFLLVLLAVVNGSFSPASSSTRPCPSSSSCSRCTRRGALAQVSEHVSAKCATAVKGRGAHEWVHVVVNDVMLHIHGLGQAAATGQRLGSHRQAHG